MDSDECVDFTDSSPDYGLSQNESATSESEGKVW